MATRADEPLIVRGGGLEGDDALKAERLRTDILETRHHMGRTVDAIEERLSPKNIKAQVSSVKDHLLEELKDAKSNLKGEVSNELSAAKQKVRDATVGRVETMVHGARHTVSEAGHTTASTIKTNPIPAALIAVGLGWLIVSGMKSGRRSSVDDRIQARSRDQWYGYDEGGPYEGVDEDGYAYTYRHEPIAPEASARGPRRMVQKGRRVVGNVGGKASAVGHDVKDRAKSVASDVEQKVSDVANTVAEKAEHVAHDASQKVSSVARDARSKGRRVVRRAGIEARRAEQTFERQLRDNPLAFGAVAVAVGAAIGLLLPHTETEDRLIGEKKDRLLETAKTRAQSAAQQAISTVQEKANEVTQSLKAEHGEPQGFQNGLSNQNGLGASNGLSKHY